MSGRNRDCRITLVGRDRAETGKERWEQMTMRLTNAKVYESARHQSTVEALARETRTEPAYVRQLYEKALAELEANAKIRGYLAVLAGKGVRTALRADRNANRR